MNLFSAFNICVLIGCLILLFILILLCIILPNPFSKERSPKKSCSSKNTPNLPREQYPVDTQRAAASKEISTKTITPNANESRDNFSLPADFPYAQKMLLTKAEYRFYLTLKEKCDKKNYLICPKVRMEDFVSVTATQYCDLIKYRGYIKSRHVDFMLCDNRLHLLAGIELDDLTHTQPDAKIIDDLKTGIFNAIRLPLFRVKISDSYAEPVDQILDWLAAQKAKNVSLATNFTPNNTFSLSQPMQ